MKTIIWGLTGGTVLGLGILLVAATVRDNNRSTAKFAARATPAFQEDSQSILTLPTPIQDQDGDKKKTSFLDFLAESDDSQKTPDSVVSSMAAPESEPSSDLEPLASAHSEIESETKDKHGSPIDGWKEPESEKQNERGSSNKLAASDASHSDQGRKLAAMNSNSGNYSNNGASNQSGPSNFDSPTMPRNPNFDKLLDPTPSDPPGPSNRSTDDITEPPHPEDQNNEDPQDTEEPGNREGPHDPPPGNVVPEPASILIWSILAGAGFALGWRQRRRHERL